MTQDDRLDCLPQVIRKFTVHECVERQAQNSPGAEQDHTGNPNGGGNIAWPRYEITADPYLELSAETRPLSNLNGSLCDFWDGVQLLWPHL